MTEIEAKGFIQGKLDCMEKCDVFNKEDKHRNNECELCEYCYSQGNFGEQKEAFRMAINALEKQITKKPRKTDSYRGVLKRVYAYVCPTCGNACLEKYMNERQNIMFCWNCGQKLDWNDKGCVVMDEEEYCYCHNDYEDEQHDCLDYMECEECPYYYADLDLESD